MVCTVSLFPPSSRPAAESPHQWCGMMTTRVSALGAGQLEGTGVGRSRSSPVRGPGRGPGLERQAPSPLGFQPLTGRLGAHTRPPPSGPSRAGPGSPGQTGTRRGVRRTAGLPSPGCCPGLAWPPCASAAHRTTREGGAVTAASPTRRTPLGPCSCPCSQRFPGSAAHPAVAPTCPPPESPPPSPSSRPPCPCPPSGWCPPSPARSRGGPSLRVSPCQAVCPGPFPSGPVPGQKPAADREGAGRRMRVAEGVAGGKSGKEPADPRVLSQDQGQPSSWPQTWAPGARCAWPTWGGPGGCEEQEPRSRDQRPPEEHIPAEAGGRPVA